MLFVVPPRRITASNYDLLLKRGFERPFLSVGDIGFCATCYVEVLQGAKELPAPVEVELQMLDTLPDALPHSRLAD
jgi:ferredoxin